MTKCVLVFVLYHIRDFFYATYLGSSQLSWQTLPDYTQSSFNIRQSYVTCLLKVTCRQSSFHSCPLMLSETWSKSSRVSKSAHCLLIIQTPCRNHFRLDPNFHVNVSPEGVWWLGDERREVSQLPGSPAAPLRALCGLLRLWISKEKRALLAERGHAFLPHPQRRQQLHPDSQETR